MPQISTGVAGTNIVASCSVPAAGDFVTGAGLKTCIDPINDDLATIKSGNCTISGTKTFADPCTASNTWTFSVGLHVGATHNIVADGSGANISGAWTLPSGSRLNMADGSTIDLMGRVRIGATKDLSDADHIMWDAVTDKRNYIRMLTGPAGNRILTLPQPVAWTQSDSVTSGSDIRKANGNIYLCSQTGTTSNSGTGPSGTGASIVDGSAKWDFKGVAPIDGDWFEVTVLLGTSAFTVGLQRAGSSDYVGKIGDGVGTSPWGSSNLSGTVRVRFDGTNWKFLSAGGSAFFGADA